MAVKRILCCDRCGQEIKLNFFPKINMNIKYQIQFSHDPYNYSESELILCSDCTKEFRKFMKDSI